MTLRTVECQLQRVVNRIFIQEKTGVKEIQVRSAAMHRIGHGKKIFVTSIKAFEGNLSATE